MKPIIKYRTYGAQLIQIEPDNIFYQSPLCSLLQSSSLRGGQPIIFPQFADRGPIKKHGIARDVDWKIIVDERTVYRHRLILTKEFFDNEIINWPHAAKITLDVEYTLGTIRQVFEVCNTGSSEFSWTGGLHPYFSVKDTQLASLVGLSGVPYEDRYLQGNNFTGPEILKWGEAACEKLFDSAPNIILDTGLNKIYLHTTGFDQWMVWNPGRQGCKDISDLPDDDWKKFVCIEPVCVQRPINLKPSEKFKGKFVISYDKFTEI